MECLKCGSTDRFKNGFYDGKQKWKCRECGHSSCRSTRRGAPIEIIRLALTLVLEGVGFNGTARILTSFGYKCTENAVIGWVRKFGSKPTRFLLLIKPQYVMCRLMRCFPMSKKRQQAIPVAGY